MTSISWYIRYLCSKTLFFVLTLVTIKYLNDENLIFCFHLSNYKIPERRKPYYLISLYEHLSDSRFSLRFCKLLRLQQPIRFFLMTSIHIRYLCSKTLFSVFTLVTIKYLNEENLITLFSCMTLDKKRYMIY